MFLSSTIYYPDFHQTIIVPKKTKAPIKGLEVRNLIFVFVKKEVVFGRIIGPYFFDRLVRFAIIL